MCDSNTCTKVYVRETEFIIMVIYCSRQNDDKRPLLSNDVNNGTHEVSMDEYDRVENKPERDFQTIPVPCSGAAVRLSQKCGIDKDVESRSL